MRKVKNKKVIQNLAKKSFGANRTRNRIAILAVALTTLLFTTIFTLGIGRFLSGYHASFSACETSWSRFKYIAVFS